MVFLLSPEHRYSFFSRGHLLLPEIVPQVKVSNALLSTADSKEKKSLLVSLSNVACGLWNLKKTGYALKFELCISAEGAGDLALLENAFIGMNFFKNQASEFFSFVDEEDLLGSFWAPLPDINDESNGDSAKEAMQSARQTRRSLYSKFIWPQDVSDVLFFNHESTKTLLQESRFQEKASVSTLKRPSLKVTFKDQPAPTKRIFVGSLLLTQSAWKRVRNIPLAKLVKTNFQPLETRQML